MSRCRSRGFGLIRCWRRVRLRRGLPLRPWRRSLRGLFALGQDLGDAHQGEFLAMAALAPRILAAALLEGDDLRAAHMVEHLGPDRRARDRGGAERGLLAADHQHLAELDHRAGLGFEPVDPEHVFGDNAILLAARFDDREHLFVPWCSCTMLRLNGPDRLLSIVMSWVAAE